MESLTITAEPRKRGTTGAGLPPARWGRLGFDPTRITVRPVARKRVSAAMGRAYEHQGFTISRRERVARIELCRSANQPAQSVNVEVFGGPNRHKSFHARRAAQQTMRISERRAVDESQMHAVRSRRDQTHRAGNAPAQLRAVIGQAAPQDAFLRFRRSLTNEPAQGGNDFSLLAPHLGQESRNGPGFGIQFHVRLHG